MRQLAFPWFPENQYSEKGFFGEGMKTILESKLQKRVTFFFNFLTTRPVSNREIKKKVKNESNFRPIFWNTSKIEPRFLQSVRKWYNHFITRQFLNGSFNVSDFETKKFSQRKFIGERTYFLSKLPRKKSDFETNFQNASECQSRLLKRVRFWN